MTDVEVGLYTKRVGDGNPELTIREKATYGEELVYVCESCEAVSYIFEEGYLYRCPGCEGVFGFRDSDHEYSCCAGYDDEGTFVRRMHPESWQEQDKYCYHCDEGFIQQETRWVCKEDGCYNDDDFMYDNEPDIIAHMMNSHVDNWSL